MTDFLRSILQTAHNANAHHSGAGAASPAAATAVKTEVRPVDQIQVPATACVTAADATASLLAMEKQRMIKVEIPEPTSAALSNTNGAPLDAGKAQRAARRDVVNARRETKRKTMSSSSSSCEDSESGDAAESSTPSNTVVDMTAAGESNAAVTTEKSKKMKTGKTTSANVSPQYVEAESKPVKKTSTASSPSSASTSSSSMSMSCGSMLFNSEIDALGEERLRQMELQLESLDPDSKEAKKKRRLIRNRMSAQLHRERKKAYVGQLEDQLMEKERELQALQEKLNAIANESLLLKQKLSQPLPGSSAAAPVAAPVAAPAAAIVQIEDDVVIKAEPVVDVASAFEAVPTPTASKDNWDYCFANLEDTEMADVAADDLLRDFDHPFASYSSMGEQDQPAMPMTQHHEIHAAKKNLVMVMGMMFSATFFGNSPFFFDVQSGSNFHSFFNANPPNEFSQMNMASKIMSSLEKSSWKDFRDIASWTTGAVAATTEEAQADEANEEEATTTTTTVVPAAASPSAASDITDSSGTCDSPAQIDDCLRLSGFETDLIDEFVYPVDDPFAPALADTNWFGDDADDFGQSDVDDNDDESEELFLSKVQLAASGEKTTNSAQASEKPKENNQQQSITSRLFEKLTTLWHEKNQVLLTVVDGKNEVTSRSVADMSSIRKSMENGSIFSTPPATHASAKTNPLANDQSVSFLYPLSAFSPAVEEKDPAASDVMFLEVSCQMSALSM